MFRTQMIAEICTWMQLSSHFGVGMWLYSAKQGHAGYFDTDDSSEETEIDHQALQGG